MTPSTIRWRQMASQWELFVLIVPTLILIGLFQYYPAASGIYHSFFRWNGADISEYVGFDNFINLVKSTEFWDSFRLAFILGGWNIVKMIPAIAVAVAIHRCRSARIQYLYRILYVIPMVIPGLVIVLIWRSFFFEATAGYLNRFLGWSGLFSILTFLDVKLGWGGIFEAGRSAAWLGDPQLIVVACVIWGFPWVGSFAVLAHLAKLQNIPQSTYEAAEIDGVNWWTKFTKIELPLLMGSIYILLVFVIIDTIRDAGMILALAGIMGGPGGKATVPALFMLRKAFMEQDMGYACAVGLVLTLVVMTLQKVSTIIMEWNERKPWQKVAIRATGIVAGTAMFFSGHLWALAALVVLISIPYAPILRLLGRTNGKKVLAGQVREQESAAVIGMMKARRRAATAEAIAASPASPAALREPKRPVVGPFLLRFSKHFFILAVLALAFLPLYLMAIVSVKDNQQFYANPAGLTQPYHWENMTAAWQSVAPALANSLFISVASTLLTLWFGLWAAYFFARARTPVTTFLWNAVLILMMMPTIANLVPLFRLLVDLDLINTISALIIVGASAGQVFAIFVLRNYIADIPQELFDASEIDGAGHFQQVRTIVLPQVAPILGTVGVMHFITQWNEFVLPLIIMRDHARLPVMVQLLRMAGEYIKLWGPLMAGYALASIPIIILFVFTMKLFMKGLAEGSQH